ncbi:MAG: DUF2273 domain-containing protein [Actinobacteria bacterium]|nr:DUF2273 domain-containing protein [Actinomycetota bacterium]
MNSLWEDILRDLMENHRGKVIGGLSGLVFSLLVIRFGFWWALFITFFVLAGYLIGRRIDETKEDLWDLLDRFLPPGHR